MGRNKELKKIRKYARKEAEKKYLKAEGHINKIQGEFIKNFKIDDYLKPCPRFVPRLFWNFLIWLVMRKK